MFLQIQPRSLFLVVFLLVAAKASEAAGTIAPGSTLDASNANQAPWSSPSSTFSLGFISSGLPNSFIAAISYSGGVPIWKAGSTPVDSAASLQFLSSGALRLVNGSGSTVWDSGTAGKGVSSASLEDTGKLSLLRNETVVWSSFDNPTDTVVPSQNFTTGMVLQSGLYSFRLISSGNLTLRWNDSIVYFTQGLNSSYDVNMTSPSLGIQNIGILSIFDPSLSGGGIMAYSNDYAENRDTLRYLKLDDDGNLRIYSSDRGSGTPIPRWAAVEDQCEVFGYCGNMGICSYNDTGTICGCPSQNFELVDPKDSRKGCKRKVETVNCPGNPTMLDMQNTQFLTYPPETESQIFFVGISACRSNCLVNPSCDASTSLSDGTGLCYFKTPGFISGYQSPALPSSSYVKVCSPVDPNPSPNEQLTGKGGGWRIHPWVVAVVVIGTILGLVALEGSLWWWCCRNSPKFGVLSAHYALLEYASETRRQKFCVWAYEEFEKGNIKAILDQRLADQEVDMEQVVRAIKVSFWCIQEQPSHRPMMSKVVQMLEGITEIERPPAPKALTEGSNGSSMTVSSNISAFSTTAASVPAPSSSSSFQIAGVSVYASGKNIERASSSLLRSYPEGQSQF
ncbi:hypothetical protein FH972_018213 [Carpinus fangiana]|uniref:non-specific serine/threonine protein kinase n=1 Tax=Carpinus fangiana TaxID=176857 RepID=A0A5N6RMT7_9ROSI|nr:hypothetical protein FH972_018213 [Carpinus fangiana]